MNASPILAFLAVILLLAGLAVPLLRMEDADVQASGKSQNLSVTACSLRVKFSHQPASATLYTGTRELAGWTPEETSDWQTDVELPFYQNLTEVRLSVQWPDGTPEAATQIFVAPESLEEKTQTYWATGTLDETHAFQWPSTNINTSPEKQPAP